LTPHEIRSILKQYSEREEEKQKMQYELGRFVGYVAGTLSMADTKGKTASQIFPFEWEKKEKKIGKIIIEDGR